MTNVEITPVVHPAAFKLTIVYFETQWVNKMKTRSSNGAQSPDIARVLGNFRLMEYNVQHCDKEGIWGGRCRATPSVQGSGKGSVYFKVLLSIFVCVTFSYNFNSGGTRCPYRVYSGLHVSVNIENSFLYENVEADEDEDYLNKKISGHYPPQYPLA